MKMKDEGKLERDFKGREKKVFKIFTRYNRNNQHKMLPIPICEIPQEFK
jgi:NAD+ synthase